MNRAHNDQAWNEQAIPNQDGRVHLITGANSGTGFEAAKVLAAHGAHVILACRSEEKAHEAMNRIRTEAPKASLEYLELDLGSLASIRLGASQVLSRHDRLDLLINNAGVMIPPQSLTADGFELQFGTNHLGHFALTGLLLERLMATPTSRVVVMSSAAHKFGTLHLNDLQFERGYRAWEAYCQSKLANLMFMIELQRRLERLGSSTIALGAHPGWAWTGLQRHATRMPFVNFLNNTLGRLLAQSAYAGVLPLLRASIDPSARGGDYFGPSGWQEWTGAPVKVQIHPRAFDLISQQQLWKASEHLTGVEFPV